MKKILKKNQYTKKKAFTLVETLVAVSILMMAVTGPLYFASESLKAAVYARDQITAFYLAQDAFEQIRKIRDDNVLKSVPWNTSLSGCETACIVNSDGEFYSIAVASGNESKSLYLSDTGIYSHLNTGTKTIFKRSVSIVPTDGDPVDDITTWANATEMKVTVSIDWNSRGTERNFQAYEFLRNLQ